MFLRISLLNKNTDRVFIRKLIKIFLFVMMINYSNIFAQDNSYNYSLSVSSGYITSFDLFNNPKVNDQIERNYYSTLKTLFSFSIEFRISLMENSLYLGIGTEMVKKSFDNSLKAMVNSNPQTIQTSDTYQLIPIELTGIYVLPFSSNKFKFYFGGGVGIYLGDFISKIGDLESVILKKDYDVGIITLVGSEYFVYKNFSVRAEMKFREPDVLIESEYPKANFNLGKDRITLYEQKFDKRVNLNGLSFIIGIVFNF